MMLKSLLCCWAKEAKDCPDLSESVNEDLSESGQVPSRSNRSSPKKNSSSPIFTIKTGGLNSNCASFEDFHFYQVSLIMEYVKELIC